MPTFTKIVESTVFKRSLWCARQRFSFKIVLKKPKNCILYERKAAFNSKFESFQIIAGRTFSSSSQQTGCSRDLITDILPPVVTIGTSNCPFHKFREKKFNSRKGFSDHVVHQRGQAEQRPIRCPLFTQPSMTTIEPLVRLSAVVNCKNPLPTMTTQSWRAF